MKKKIFAVILSAILVFTLGAGASVFADETSELQGELDDVNQQKEQIEGDLQAKIAELDKQKAEVERIQAELDEKQAQINTTVEEIKEIKAGIEERRDGLNNRLRVMYKKGSVGYIDVLLGSSSISELLSNVEMIQRIYKNDQKVLKELKKQHEELEEKQTKLQEDKVEIDKQKAVADEANAKLQEQKDVLQAEFDKVEADAERIASEIAALQKPKDEVEFVGGEFMWPANTYYITSPFGFRVHPVTGVWTGHRGVDIGCSMNSPIRATAEGTVIISQWYYGYGYAVVIDHGGGVASLYGHNESLCVSPGQHVNQGDLIAYSGSTGISTGPHLHFEITIDGNPVDPMQYF